MAGDVPDRYLADRAARPAVVRMAMEHRVRPVGADGAGEASGPEERPDPLRLAGQGVARRGVVEEDEAPVAAGDRFEALLEGIDLLRGLRVHLAKQRLAEVGDL